MRRNNLGLSVIQCGSSLAHNCSLCQSMKTKKSYLEELKISPLPFETKQNMFNPDTATVVPA